MNITNKEKQLELLNVLFDASRVDCNEEWSDEAYTLADLIKLVDQSPEEAIRELLTADLIDTVINIYKIPPIVAKGYVTETPEFMDNVMDRVYETILFETENWIESTDILEHQEYKGLVLEVK